MKRIGKGAAVVTVSRSHIAVEFEPNMGACTCIAREWLEHNDLVPEIIRPGDKLEVRIRLIKKGKG